MTLSRILTGTASRLRNTMYRWRGVQLDGKCWLRAIEIPRHHRAIRLGTGVGLDNGITLLVVDDEGQLPKLTIGDRTYINRHTMLDASELIEIGVDCMIGPFCYITDHDHVSDAEGRPGGGGLRSAAVHIEARCWLGAHVTVLKGVTIGQGSVVGAGSVVTKSLPAGSVAVGNPARVLRSLS